MRYPTATLLVSGLFLLVTTLAQAMASDGDGDKRKQQRRAAASNLCPKWHTLEPTAATLPTSFAQGCVIQANPHTWYVLQAALPASPELEQASPQQLERWVEAGKAIAVSRKPIHQLSAHQQQTLPQGLIFVQASDQLPPQSASTALQVNRPLCKRAQNHVICIRGSALTRRQLTTYLAKARS